VIPYSIWDAEGFDWTRVDAPAGATATYTTWLGAPCHIGRIQVWAQTRAGAFRSFLMDAKFPQSDPKLPEGNAEPPILIGLHFLEQLGGKVGFQFDGDNDPLILPLDREGLVRLPPAVSSGAGVHTAPDPR
jgi:hypothetical protein